MNPRRRQFVREYLVDLNGKAAAERAGYRPSNAKVTAHRLMRVPAVKEAIDQALAERARRIEVSADRVIAEFARIAFADVRLLWDWGKDGPALKRPGGMSAEDAAAVASMSVRESSHGKSTRVQLHDKTRALVALARHLGLFDGPHGGDPRARHEEAERVREMLRRRIEEIAARGE